MKSQESILRRVPKWVSAVAKCIIAGGFAATVAFSQTQVFEPIPPPTNPNTGISGFASLSGVIHAKATPDEWFCSAGGSGLSTGLLDPSGFDVQVIYDLYLSPNPTNKCLTGGEFAGSPRIPKVNQSYVWGTVLVNNQIFFGTASNGQCVTEGGVTGGGGKAYNSGAWTCQFEDSPYTPIPIPSQIGDNRPPRFYKYDIATQKITDITPKLGGSPPATACGTPTSQNPYCMEPLWLQTRGIRSATSYTETQGQGAGHTYVFASGPALTQGNNKLNFFAYDTTLNQWVAEAQLSGYNDQRHWVTDSNGIKYTPTGKAGQGGGSLIRYYGNFQLIPPPPVPSGNNGYAQIPICGLGLVTGPPTPGQYSCFNFADVGDIDGVGTDADVHEGRIVVATWTVPGLGPIPGTCTPTGCQGLINNVAVPFPYAGLWMSPVIPAGGLTSANAGPNGGWTKPWNALMYEPDPVIACSYATGAIKDFNGVLYIGTMNVPYMSTGRITSYYGKPTSQSVLQPYLTDTWRPVVMLTATGLTTATPQIKLLYGAGQLFVYHPGPDVNSFTFVLTPNNMGGAPPLYGGPGFGNPYNNYVWSMNIWNNRLYVGTMDWSYMAGIMGPQMGALGGFNITKFIPPVGYGADFLYFTNTTSKAILENSTGLGNQLNYGVRNIVPYTYPNGASSMFIGIANAMNLATTGAGPYGGWELLELKAGSTVTKR